mmetsp:Transcript_100294/g.251454  ORF Transcript_100294/g.251454 Transcript_100294/m.251454 type:complete len:282 (-) Transcript_100294:974-1819(-)
MGLAEILQGLLELLLLQLAMPSFRMQRSRPLGGELANRPKRVERKVEVLVRTFQLASLQTDLAQLFMQLRALNGIEQQARRTQPLPGLGERLHGCLQVTQPRMHAAEGAEHPSGLHSSFLGLEAPHIDRHSCCGQLTQGVIELALGEVRSAEAPEEFGSGETCHGRLSLQRAPPNLEGLDGLLVRAELCVSCPEGGKKPGALHGLEDALDCERASGQAQLLKGLFCGLLAAVLLQSEIREVRYQGGALERLQCPRCLIQCPGLAEGLDSFFGLRKLGLEGA